MILAPIEPYDPHEWIRVEPVNLYGNALEMMPSQVTRASSVQSVAWVDGDLLVCLDPWGCGWK